LLPAESFSSRPKVLEFIPNSLTPDIQKGCLVETFSTFIRAIRGQNITSTEDATDIYLGEFDHIIREILHS